MPIAIVLDKSSFQMLNPDEVTMLHNYYIPNITPVLVMEVLGDLKKEAEGDLSKEKVIKLARKLLPRNSAVNIYYPKLIEMELRGESISMDFRPMVGEIVPKVSATGQKGFHINNSAEENSIVKWRNGDFNSFDEISAQLWREVTTEKDLLVNLKASLKKGDTGEAKLGNWNSLVTYVEQLLDSKENQDNILRFIITEFGIDADSASAGFGRFSQSDDRHIKTYFPYSYYCCRVKLLFYLGLKNDLFGTRPTNFVDLQYLYYLPFGLVFSSNDNFHKVFVPNVIGDFQTFVTGEDLKKDLRDLVSYRSTLFEKKDVERTLHEPPQLPESFTYKMWKKYLHWPSHIRRDFSASEMEEAKNKMDEFIAAGEVAGDFDTVHDPQFITKEYEITIDDFCPCGSGKKFKDCHMKGK